MLCLNQLEKLSDDYVPSKIRVSNAQRWFQLPKCVNPQAVVVSTLTRISLGASFRAVAARTSATIRYLLNVIK